MRLSLKPERRDRRQPSEVDRVLEGLLDPEEIIDRFDASYIDDLPDLLREIHGVTDANVRSHARWPDLERLWTLGGEPASEFTVERLPEVVRAAAVDEGRFTPREASQRTRKKYRHTEVPIWRRAAGRRLARDGGDAADVINELHKEYSVQSGGDHEQDFTDLGREETGDPWTPLIIELRETGVLDAGEPALTIGPRWVGEIHYFRERLGLTGTIGLDLFTHDEDLVKVGDMHSMPFEDDTFGLIYQRNTFDKSYDIRAALRECVRVLRDGGVLISDDCYAYTDGVSELSRTSIKHNRQLLRVIRDNVGEVLYDAEAPTDVTWIQRVGQLAVRIKKP